MTELIMGGVILLLLTAIIFYNIGLNKGQRCDPIPAPCSHKWVNLERQNWVRTIDWSKYEYTVFIDRCEHCGKLKTTEI